MSKITFRADDELVQRLEGFDASKSEVMREALREYLGGAERTADASSSDDVGAAADGVDAAIAARVDELVTDRLSPERDVNVNINFDDVPSRAPPADAGRDRRAPHDDGRKTPQTEGATEKEQTCGQCGERTSSEHVYCPNCGEKSTHRVFCECGDELRSDWGFCPSCGRRTPAADVLDQP